MKKFRVYFEMFGRKMKITVIANNVQEAQTKVKDQIKFHKIIQEDDPLQKLKDFLNI